MAQLISINYFVVLTGLAGLSWWTAYGQKHGPLKCFNCTGTEGAGRNKVCDEAPTDSMLTDEPRRRESEPSGHEYCLSGIQYSERDKRWVLGRAKKFSEEKRDLNCFSFPHSDSAGFSKGATCICNVDKCNTDSWNKLMGLANASSQFQDQKSPLLLALSVFALLLTSTGVY